MGQKYIFDTKTLSYRPYKPTKKHYVLAVLRYTGISILTGILLYAGTMVYNFTPNSILLNIKNNHIVNKLLRLESKLENKSQQLQKIEEKDDYLYRSYAELSPLPVTIRQAGFGGVDRYQKFNIYSYGELMGRIAKKVDILENQIKIQKKSFDEVNQLSYEKVKFYAAKPGLSPLLKSDYYRISDYFGNRFHPVHKKWKQHTGIDYAALRGTPVYSTGDGKIIATGWDSGYGNRIIIDHGFGYKTIYAHLQLVKVKVGETVKRGKLIGLVGNTGVSTGPHLHYEIRKNNLPVNPLFYYLDDLSEKEYSAITHN